MKRSPIHGIVRGKGPCPHCGIQAWKWKKVLGSSTRRLVCMGCDTPRGEREDWFECPQCRLVQPMPAVEDQIHCRSCTWTDSHDVSDKLKNVSTDDLVSELRKRQVLQALKEMPESLDGVYIHVREKE